MNRGFVIASAIVAAAAAAATFPCVPAPATSSADECCTRLPHDSLSNGRQARTTRCCSNPQPPGCRRARSRSTRSSGTAAAIATHSIRRSRAGRQDKPAYVDFVRIPVIWGPVHRQHAKLFYTLQALGRGDLHTKVFDTIHRQDNLLAARPTRKRAPCISHSSRNTASPRRRSTTPTIRRRLQPICSAPSSSPRRYVDRQRSDDDRERQVLDRRLAGRWRRRSCSRSSTISPPAKQRR